MIASEDTDCNLSLEGVASHLLEQKSELGIMSPCAESLASFRARKQRACSKACLKGIIHM